MKNSNNSTDFTSETIGTRLKRLRKEKGYTQKYIALDILHYTDERLYRECEKDRHTLGLDYLITLADFYGVSVDYLLCRSHYISCDNEMISQSIGLSDKAIENIRTKIIAKDIEYNANVDYARSNNPDMDYPPRWLLDYLNLILSSDDIGDILMALDSFMSAGYNIPVHFDRVGGVSGWYATDQHPWYSETNHISLARSMANPRDKMDIEIDDTFTETIALKQIEKALYNIKNKGLAN